MRKAPDQLRPALPKRIVSGQRSKALTKPVNFRMPTEELEHLDAAAARQHRSRSELILLGLRRCMKDDVWHPTSGTTSHLEDAASPAPEVVQLSQVLIGLAMSLDAIYAGRKRPSKSIQEAAAILADARKMLSELLEQLR